jgi:hypothetical protein
MDTDSNQEAIRVDSLAIPAALLRLRLSPLSQSNPSIRIILSSLQTHWA